MKMFKLLCYRDMMRENKLMRSEPELWWESRVESTELAW